MAKTKTWKVYWAGKSARHETLVPSAVYDFSTENDVRVIETHNFDKTGTHEYSVVLITRNTAEECDREFWLQMGSGRFAISDIEKVEEV